MDITPIGTIGGNASWLLAIAWSMTGFTAIFVALRLYTRLAIVKSYGLDDNIYNASFVFLLACSIFVQISSLYGLGQNQQAIFNDSHDRLTQCLLYLIIAQIFGVTAMAVAKVSLGLFLLRLVTVPWHRWAIWGAIAGLMLVSGVTSFAFAFQCSPPRYLWDKTVEGGSCPLSITPFAITLGAGCVVADLFFALFPFVFIWKLNKPLKERAIIAGAMALGLVAAACGVKRTIGLGALASKNYTVAAVATCAWSIAELAVTLVCIAIPACLPLVKHIFGSGAARPSSTTYERHRNGTVGKFELRTVGGSTMPGVSGLHSDGKSRDRDGTDSQRTLHRTIGGHDSKTDNARSLSMTTTLTATHRDSNEDSSDADLEMQTARAPH